MPPASGSAEVAHGSAQNGFTAVLFDWRGTLFHDESDQDWIRASAASIGRTPSDDEVDHLAKRLGAAAEHPLVRTARERADCSVELHRAATLLELRLAGFDDELALAVWKRDGGALGVGMTTVILASVPNFTPRGLDVVLRLAPPIA